MGLRCQSLSLDIDMRDKRELRRGLWYSTELMERSHPEAYLEPMHSITGKAEICGLELQKCNKERVDFVEEGSLTCRKTLGRPRNNVRVLE